MSKNLDTIIFDLGGVLIDWNPEYVFRKVFADESEMHFFFREICTPEWNAQQDAGRPLAEAEPYYDKAQQEAMLSDALTWAGAAILLADVAWYGIRQKKRRRKEQLYQKYCRDKSENLSSVKWNLQPATGQAGIGLAVRF